MVGPIIDYINMERYEKHLPSFFNRHYSINLIDAVEHLPKRKDIPKK